MKRDDLTRQTGLGASGSPLLAIELLRFPLRKLSMETLTLPIRDIVNITDELARYWRDHHLMDQLTVTRGYAELSQLTREHLLLRKASSLAAATL